MAVRKTNASAAEYSDEPVSCVYSADAWTRLALPTYLVNFTCGDTRDADLRPLRTPDWSVAIPNRYGRTVECPTGRDNRRGSSKEQKDSHLLSIFPEIRDRGCRV